MHNLTKEQAFEKATKIDASAYTSWISDPDLRGSGGYEGGGYHANPTAFMEACVRDDVELPAFVWATFAEGLSLNAEWILEQALEEHHEDAADQISSEAKADLRAFLDAWVKRKDVAVTTYHEDQTRAIVFSDADRAKFAELKAAREDEWRAGSKAWADATVNEKADS